MSVRSNTGSYIPFPESEDVRRAIRDPRPSVRSRYIDIESYLNEIRGTAKILVQEGLMLEEDIERFTAEVSNWRWLLRESGI